MKLGYKWTLKDYIFFMILLLEDAGMFNILPIGIAQILIIFLGFTLIVENMNKGLFLDKKIVFLLLYMAIITFTHHFDNSTISGFGLFIMELIVLYFYMYSIKSFKVLFSIIYKAAVVLAVIGIVQEVGYIANIRALTDMTIFGFPRPNVYATGNLLARVSSLYSEPASLNNIVSCAFFIGLFGDKELGVNKFKNLILMIFVLFTQSSILYLSIVLIVVIYTFYSDVTTNKKIFLTCIVLVVCALLVVGKFDFMNLIFQKLGTLKTASSENSTDLSAFAVMSNLKISLAKIKDGLIFGTGFNSHRFYYDAYVSRFYTTIFMKLNTTDAASMYIRSISEFGLVGILYIILGLIKSFACAVKDKNNALLLFTTVLAISLIRDGNYNRSLTLILFIFVFFFRKHENILFDIKRNI